MCSGAVIKKLLFLGTLLTCWRPTIATAASLAAMLLRAAGQHFCETLLHSSLLTLFVV